MNNESEAEKGLVHRVLFCLKWELLYDSNLRYLGLKYLLNPPLLIWNQEVFRIKEK